MSKGSHQEDRQSSVGPSENRKTSERRETAPSAEILQGNCLDVMDGMISLKDFSKFNLVFADPPYFLSNGGITCKSGRMASVNKGDWDRSEGIEALHAFNLAWLSRCRELLDENGSIWVSGTHHAIFSVGFAMRQLGFRVLNDIVWEKPNPPPNLGCRTFTHSTELLVWASRSEKARHFFDYAQMKKLNGGKQMKNVWRLPTSSKQEKVHGRHPTQKPLALLERVLLASTAPGDWVLDPFSGSGTTGVACAAMGRNFVGIEIDPEYVRLGQSRIEEVRK